MSFKTFKFFLAKINKPLYNDSLWAIIGNVTLKGLGLLGSIFVARFLGSEVFGEYGGIKNTIVSVAIFSTYGLGYTATKYVADFSRSNPSLICFFIVKAYKITLVLSIVISILMLIFSNLIAEEFLKAPHLVNMLKYTSLWIVFNALTTLQIGVLSGLGLYKSMAKINTIVGFFTFFSSVILTWFYYLEGAIFALIISQLFNWCLYYLFIKKNVYKGENKSSKELISYREILLFSFPVAMQEMIYSISSWISTLIIIKYSNYSELGLYTAAVQWSSIVLFIPAVLRNVVLSNLSKEDNKNTQNIIMKKMILLNIITTLIPIIVIIVFSGFISQVYGETFKQIKNVLYISLFSTIFISINTVYSQAYMSLGKNWTMFLLRLLRDLCVLGLAFYFIIQSYYKIGGAMSLAFSTVLANVVFMFFMAYIYKFNLK